VTKLGRLVKNGRVKSIEEVFLHSLPVKEIGIIEQFLPGMGIFVKLYM
jgi:small subunit ribosomal protein S2e